MLLIVGTVRVPGRIDPGAKDAMERMITASRAEAGCIHYSYSVDLLEEGLIHVNECWQDRESLEAHFASAHLAAWRSTWKSLEISDRNLSLYEVDEAEPV